MSGGAKRIPLVPQYVKMMGAESTHISNNDKLGGTNYGLWKFRLKNILIRDNAYHYVVLNPNKNVMEKPNYHCTRTTKSKDDHQFVDQKQISSHTYKISMIL
jgi:hypothetical protein